jgi:microsomal epoxide hydrolase
MSDGVRLHYRDAGEGGPTLVFLPGWLMPAEIFDAQLEALSAHHRVVVMSPRSQGQSDAFAGPHTPERRARDIQDFVSQAVRGPFVLVGWSLGVMEGLDYVQRFRPKDLKGMVLVDNSIGEARPPRASGRPLGPQTEAQRQDYLRAFVRSMFHSPQPEAFLALLDRSAQRVPRDIADELLAKPYPREYYKSVIYREAVPVLYAITPRWKDQGEALKAHLPTARVSIYPEAGHALFVDAAARFNADVEHFLEGIR